MSLECAWCGARYATPGETCEDRFNLALAREFEDPAFGMVHHLTVPAYMLQHNRYSHVGWLVTRDLLASFVRGEVDPAGARRQYKAKYSGGERAGSITKGPRFAQFDQITWTRTIADVRFDSAEVYRADVEAWAAAVVADTEAVIAALGTTE